MSLFNKIVAFRIFLTAMIAYLLGAVTGYYGNIIIMLMAVSVTIVTFFIYEVYSFEMLEKEGRRANATTRRTKNQ